MGLEIGDPPCLSGWWQPASSTGAQKRARAVMDGREDGSVVNPRLTGLRLEAMAAMENHTTEWYTPVIHQKER